MIGLLKAANKVVKWRGMMNTVIRFKWLLLWNWGYIGPLCCWLYIDSFADMLTEARLCVECWKRRVAALQYADDMVLFAADDEEAIRLSLRMV